MAAVAPPVPSGAPPSRPTARAAPRAGVVRDVGTARHEQVRAARWTTSGAIKVLGDVDVGEGILAGLVTVGGKVSADSLRARGGLEVGGTVDVRGALSLDGTTHVSGTVHARSINARGQVRADGAVAADRELVVGGLLEAPSVSAGLVDLAGAAVVPGELVARGSVTCRVNDPSSLGTVRAPTVVIHGPATGLVPTLWRKVFGGSVRVAVERIEADRVELASVDVRFVRATSIVLGPGSHVAEIEGTVVRRHRTARVGPESRSPPPYGLRR